MLCGCKDKKIILDKSRNDVLYRYVFPVMIHQQHQLTCSFMAEQIVALGNLRTIK